MNTPKACSRFVQYGSLLLALALAVPFATGAADIGKTFATPEEAVAALVQATSAESGSDLRAIFGPAAAELQNPDRVQATNEFHTFTAALNATNRLVHESATKCVLEVGANSWPFPVPIVKKDGRWFFDTEAGKEEILSRRIGKNELAVLAGRAGLRERPARIRQPRPERRRRAGVRAADSQHARAPRTASTGRPTWMVRSARSGQWWLRLKERDTA